MVLHNMYHALEVGLPLEKFTLKDFPRYSLHTSAYMEVILGHSKFSPLPHMSVVMFCTDGQLCRLYNQTPIIQPDSRLHNWTGPVD